MIASLPFRFAFVAFRPRWRLFGFPFDSHWFRFGPVGARFDVLSLRVSSAWGPFAPIPFRLGPSAFASTPSRYDVLLFQSRWRSLRFPYVLLWLCFGPVGTRFGSRSLLVGSASVPLALASVPARFDFGPVSACVGPKWRSLRTPFASL